MNDIKNRKKKLIDKLEKWCNESKISNKNIGAWVRAYHFNAPIYMLFFVLYGPKWLADIGLFNLLIIILMFIYLRSCWLSLLEKRICSDDVNIVDLWIELFGYKVHYDNKIKLNEQRYRATYIIASIYLVILLGSYYNRFF
jgi:hypothetical protein